jgi:hypothetical protein
MAPERLDTPRRSTRLVPMVLPVLHGATNARQGRSADQTLEGNPPACASASARVRAWRCLVPQAATAGAAALGLRQPQAVREDRDHRVGEFVRLHLAIHRVGRLGGPGATGATCEVGAWYRWFPTCPVPWWPLTYGGHFFLAREPSVPSGRPVCGRRYGPSYRQSIRKPSAPISALNIMATPWRATLASVRRWLRCPPWRLLPQSNK